ncbi:MAG: TetR/AcrR family transcriptional regulator [Actinoallomurus sp.]
MTPVKRQARAERTRAALLTAARELFEERGFLDAKISEICERAGVAYGSFYTHFADKDAVFAELIDEMLGGLLAVMRAEPLNGDGPAARIARANRAYLRAYRDNARLMAVFEQVATFSPGMRDTYLRAWGVFYDRQERAIREWQEAGLVPGDVDPRTAAVALATMIGRTAYTWYVLGRPHDDGDVEQLTRLYCRAIGM